MLTVGSIFSGIGGFDLGFERAGMRVVWQCERDEFCRRVLARHWPGVPCHPDVRALVGESEGDGRGAGWPGGSDPAGAWEQEPDGSLPVPVPVPYVDVLCGGFPCQDISVAGRGAGIDGARSGLWGEYARLIRELRPRYVVVENVAALLARGLGRVLGDLAALGYDAEWDCIPASAVGAPHRRDRLWLVAYPAGGGGAAFGPDGGAEAGADPRTGGAGAGARAVADADDGGRAWGSGEQWPGWRGEPADGGWWATEPDVGRVAHGVPDRVDRLAALGNALVPQIAEWIGRRLIEDARVSSGPRAILRA